MWQQILGTLGIILVGGVFYLIGPVVVNWLMSHVFVTAYQKTLHKKDLEKRQKNTECPVCKCMANTCRCFDGVWHFCTVF